jgi:hypothetical protein
MLKTHTESTLGGDLALARLSREMLVLMIDCLGPEETPRTSARLDTLHETEKFKALLRKADVTIVARGLSLANSLALEQELMDTYKPALNTLNTINDFNLRYRQYNQKRLQS